MQKLADEHSRRFQSDGYLHIEQVLNTDEVEFFRNEIDRIRQIPGYEPDKNPDMPRGHYGWMDHTQDLDSEGFMDRKELLIYGQPFIDLIDSAPVFDYIVDLMGPNILLRRGAPRRLCGPPAKHSPAIHTPMAESPYGEFASPKPVRQLP